MAVKPGRATINDITAVNPALKREPPSPPERLTELERVVWGRVVNSMPYDWFRPEVHDLLVEYCRRVVRSDFLSSKLADLTFTVDSYKRYQAMADIESKGIASLATKLRLTNQSRYDPITAARNSRDSGSPLPWDGAPGAPVWENF